MFNSSILEKTKWRTLQILIIGFASASLFSSTCIRVSQIAGVFQKMIFESCTLYHIMPFAKIIGPVEKKMNKS